MVRKEDLKIGDIVYIEGSWSSGLYSGEVYEIQDKGALVHGKNYINADGSDGDRYYGSCGNTYENIYLTAEDAINGIKAKHQAKVDEYCKQITDIESMIKFSMNHCLNGEEYTNWDAVKAYKIMAKNYLMLI